MGKTTEARILTSPAILARLTPSSCDLHYHSGGVPEITNGEIAGALAKCSEGAKLYAAVQYQGAREYEGLLMSEIRLALSGIWARKGWRIQKPGLLQGLAWLAITDHEPAFRRCRKCNGSKGRTISRRTETGFTSEWQDCAKCQGSGQRRVKEKERAQMVGVEYHYWVRTMADRYRKHVLPLLDRWDREVRTSLNDGLDGNK